MPTGAHVEPNDCWCWQGKDQKKETFAKGKIDLSKRTVRCLVLVFLLPHSSRSTFAARPQKQIPAAGQMIIMLLAAHYSSSGRK